MRDTRTSGEDIEAHFLPPGHEATWPLFRPQVTCVTMSHFVFHSLGSCDPPAWIPPTVTPCGYGRLWGPGPAVWQQPDTRCAPTPAWIPPTVTLCGYGRLWGPGSAVWQQPDTRCAP